jgi:hypothetical protein
VSAKIDAALGGTRESDLARRIAATPAGAEIRAIFLHAADDAFTREAPGRVSSIKRVRPRGYAMVPVRSFLEELHELGAALGPTAEAGTALLHANTAAYLVNHPGARLFVTARDRDPMVLLGRLERSRSIIASYGDWRVTGTRGDLLVTVRNEWVWLESMWLPLIASVFPACGLPPADIEAKLESPFNATLRVRW